MRKIITIIFVLCLIAVPTSFAEEPSDITTVSSTSASTSLSPTPVGYNLPFPGLLPGNPLYVFKVSRDKIVEFFITDPLKKSHFYLLQADKHLQSGVMLWDLGKTDEAMTMITKGEDYLDMSLSRAVAAKQAGEADDEILSNLNLSSMKHQEVIKSLMKNVSSDMRDKLKIELQKSMNIEKTVKQIKPQK